MNFRWKKQDFDTEIFGFTVAKILQISSEGTSQEIQKRIASLIKEFKKNGIDYATYRLPASEFSLIHKLENAGFVIIDAIIAMNIDTHEIEQSLGKNIRAAMEKDLPQLKSIVRKSFTTNRFYNDPVIPKDKADIVYEKWIENSLNGEQADDVLVWEEGQDILGFITLQKKGHIPLVAVSVKARGKGIAKHLIKASFKKFQDWGCKTIEIETSLGNSSALRAYEGCGFRVLSSFFTFRWIS